MKICEKCNAQNSDSRIFCVDCGEKLGDKLSDIEQEQLAQNTKAQIEKLSNKIDPFYISVFDKVVGGISIACFVALCVFSLIRLFNAQGAQYFWIAAIFFVLSAVEAFAPKLTWELERIRLSFYVDGSGDFEPNDTYLFWKRFSMLFSLLSGAIIFAVNILLVL